MFHPRLSFLLAPLLAVAAAGSAFAQAQGQPTLENGYRTGIAIGGQAIGDPAPDGQPTITSVRIGTPVLLQGVARPLGSVIEPPEHDKDGKPITCEAKPSNADSGDFYWSEHAQEVFATKAGKVEVEWEISKPAERVGKMTQTYLISNSPVKPAKKIYWTEKEFTGPKVHVPVARVSALKVIYNAAVPEKVETEFESPFQARSEGEAQAVAGSIPGPPPERRTLWFDPQDRFIHAYNAEGRVFVEILGNIKAAGFTPREHLGFEIVDVIKDVPPREMRVDVGDRVRPPIDKPPLSAEVVAGKPTDNDPYLYEHVSLGGTRRDLYAIRETTPIDLDGDGPLPEQQSNEMLIHWMEEGVMGLRWPKAYTGYIFQWPELPKELSKYSVYARPEDPGDSEQTAVQLDSANNPILTYQDDSTRQHAKLTPQHKFFTTVTADKPEGKALIRYTREEHIWYERVLSRRNTAFDRYETPITVDIGQRLDPVDGAQSLAGYIHQPSGTAFNPQAYVNPFERGIADAEKGAIIGVNGLDYQNEQRRDAILEVWWHKKNQPPEGSPFSPTYWPSYVQRYQLQWPEAPQDIVLASNHGSGDLDDASSGSIYRQPDPDKPGYNPNEEHALISGGVAWALRDDLNHDKSSKPFVLVHYTNPKDRRPAMRVFEVLRESSRHKFNYQGQVGAILQAPMPLPRLAKPKLDEERSGDSEIGRPHQNVGGSADYEVTLSPTDQPINASSGSDEYGHYTRFTFEDRKGSHWIYRGPHADGVNVGSVTDESKSFKMRYFYKTATEFDFPAERDGVNQPPPPGTIVPYLRAYANGTDRSEGFKGNPLTGAPLDIVFKPFWPETAPVLSIGDTLGDAQWGLPDVRHQTSVQVLYQQSIAQDMVKKTPSARLHDPTREKTYALNTDALEKLPASVVTSDYRGKKYFPSLPPHLSHRLFLDPDKGEHGSLVFKGEFKEETLGEDYFLVNVMTDSDVEAVKALASTDDDDKGRWDAAIDGLSTTLETFVEDPNRPGTFKVDHSRNVGVSELAEIKHENTAVDSYALTATGGGTGFVVLATGNGNEKLTPTGEPVALHVFKVEGPLYRGELKVIASANPLDEKITLQHSADFAGKPEDYEFAWLTAQPVDGNPPGLTGTADLSGWEVIGKTKKDNPSTEDKDESAGEAGKPRHTIQGAGVETLGDNYVTMRYRAKAGTEAAKATGGSEDQPGEWSGWMPPQLAEGWIKRVLAGINPFNQRTKDLSSHQVDTDVSMLSQAGKRWEGDIALNLENINDFGLIEVYETVLKRGKMLSIDGDPPLSDPAANDALLLAAGYLNDLYMLHGNEAFADAANPTIAFDTAGGDFGEFSTALFAFQGQLSSVLDEELALLRGRDDFLQPRITLNPIYNRLIWNYTRGINSGEAVYALNYNIKDLEGSGAADAADAAKMFPQGHGDAYGHYLTALKVYYGLLSNERFTWTPRSEAVLVAGQPVSVDYFDERKFAAAAAALTRTASQVLDLTYRRQFKADENAGWQALRDGKRNDSTGRTRHWGTDQWACRAGQGAFFHWVTANSLLPAKDPNPNHEGIQKIDRTTVPELAEIVAHANSIQQTLDTADARMNPLGLRTGAISFDISPTEIDAGKTHFEQVYDRAVRALGNAVFAFNQAKESTRFLRQQDNSLDQQRAAIRAQETAFENELIEIYGTPYPDDIGPGKTYKQGYAGPDFQHFAYVDLPESEFDPVDKNGKAIELNPRAEFKITLSIDPVTFTGREDKDNLWGREVEYTLNARGEVVKPESWTGRRAHPGRLQTAFSRVYAARTTLRIALSDYDALNNDLESLLEAYDAAVDAHRRAGTLTRDFNNKATFLELVILGSEIAAKTSEFASGVCEDAAEAVKEALPRNVGMSNDVTAPARGGILAAAITPKQLFSASALRSTSVAKSTEFAIKQLERQLAKDLTQEHWTSEQADLIHEVQLTLNQFGGLLFAINAAVRDLDQANRDLLALKAQGEALKARRETFRQRSAAIIQGYRTQDFAFRTFGTEALEKYKVLFDLAARYTFLAAHAYDYETGLLDTSGSDGAATKSFEDIVQARALGVVRPLGGVDGGKPQFSSSETGDPGLAGVLARMDSNWSVLRSRLGFNNPDRYRTTFSLRKEKFRKSLSETEDGAWQKELRGYQKENVLDDPDVRRYAMQIGDTHGARVPGLVIEFETEIARGVNFFGKPLEGGDHTFSPSAFATKIRAAGIAFDGYLGMDSPTSAGGTLDSNRTPSPPDPNNDNALSATPFIYLIPVGVDSMRSPPLGDTSQVRTWMVEDQAIPLPFDIRNTDFATRKSWVSAESLTESVFTPRKHQAFRAVPAGTVFSSAPGFTNSRLIGRSVWNSKWKLVIPGDTLHADPEKGLDTFIETVRDIQLFLETYSYSGN